MGKVKASNRLLRHAWRRSFVGLSVVGMFCVFTNLLQLATPLYVMQVTDRITSSRSVESLVMLTVIALAALLTGSIIDVMRKRMLIHWAAWIEWEFSPKLVQDGLSAITDANAPSKALRDVATVRQFVAGSALIAWLDVVWAPLWMAIVYLIEPLLAMIVIIAIIAVLGLTWLEERATRTSSEVSRHARSFSKKWVMIGERNAETIGPMSMADSITRRWSSSVLEGVDEGIRAKVRSTTIYSTIFFLRRCLRIALLCIGILLVVSNSQTLGAVLAAAFLGRMAFKLCEKALSKQSDLADARKAYARMAKALSAETPPPASIIDHNMPATLSIDAVSHRYAKDAPAVIKDATITLQPGEVLCIIGPSASGKTTFSRLASGLLRPKSGAIRLGDVDIARLSRSGHARHIGYLPQEVRLFIGTVRENIARMELGDFRQVIEAAQLIGIHETLLKLPKGYDTQIDDNEPLLSTGQRKAVALARAFYGWPQLIVLDEPEPHIDRAGRQALMRALETCTAQGSIVIATTQSKTMSKIADKVLLLDGEGTQLLEDGITIDALSRSRTARQQKAKGTSKVGKL